jgi:hypothetical protein
MCRFVERVCRIGHNYMIDGCSAWPIKYQFMRLPGIAIAILRGGTVHAIEGDSLTAMKG